MLTRAKKHVLSSYSYSNLSLHRKIAKTTQKWVAFFCTKKTQTAVRRWQAAKKTRPTSMCVGAAWVRRPAAIFDHGPFGFDGMFFDYE